MELGQWFSKLDIASSAPPTINTNTLISDGFFPHNIKSINNAITFHPLVQDNSFQSTSTIQSLTAGSLMDNLFDDSNKSVMQIEKTSNTFRSQNSNNQISSANFPEQFEQKNKLLKLSYDESIDLVLEFCPPLQNDSNASQTLTKAHSSAQSKSNSTLSIDTKDIIKKALKKITNNTYKGGIPTYNGAPNTYKGGASSSYQKSLPSSSVNSSSINFPHCLEILSSNIPENFLDYAHSSHQQFNLGPSIYTDNNNNLIFNSSNYGTFNELNHYGSGAFLSSTTSPLASIQEIEGLFSSSTPDPRLSFPPHPLPLSDSSSTSHSADLRFDKSSREILPTLNLSKDINSKSLNSLNNDFEKVIDFFSCILSSDSTLGSLSPDGFWMATSSLNLLKKLQLDVQNKVSFVSMKSHKKAIKNNGTTKLPILGQDKLKSKFDDKFRHYQTTLLSTSKSKQIKLAKQSAHPHPSDNSNTNISLSSSFTWNDEASKFITSSTTGQSTNSVHPHHFHDQRLGCGALNNLTTSTNFTTITLPPKSTNHSFSFGSEIDFPRFVCGKIDRQDSINEFITLKLKDNEKNPLYCKVELYSLNSSFLALCSDRYIPLHCLKVSQQIQISSKKSGIPHRIWRDATILNINNSEISASFKLSNQEIKSISLKMEDFIPPLYPCLEPLKGSWRLQPKILEIEKDLYVGSCISASSLDSPLVFNDCVIQKCYFDEKHVPRQRSRPQKAYVPTSSSSNSISKITDNTPHNNQNISQNSSTPSKLTASPNQQLSQSSNNPSDYKCSTDTNFNSINDAKLNNKTATASCQAYSNKLSNLENPKAPLSIVPDLPASTVLEGSIPPRPVRWIQIFFLASRKQELLAVNEFLHYKMPYDVHPHTEDSKSANLSTLKSLKSSLIWVIPRMNFKSKVVQHRVLDKINASNTLVSTSKRISSDEKRHELISLNKIPNNPLDTSTTSSTITNFHTLIFINLELISHLTKASRSKLLHFLHPELFHNQQQDLSNPSSYWFLIDDELQCTLSVWNEMCIPTTPEPHCEQLSNKDETSIYTQEPSLKDQLQNRNQEVYINSNPTSQHHLIPNSATSNLQNSNANISISEGPDHAKTNSSTPKLKIITSHNSKASSNCNNSLLHGSENVLNSQQKTPDKAQYHSTKSIIHPHNLDEYIRFAENELDCYEPFNFSPKEEVSQPSAPIHIIDPSPLLSTKILNLGIPGNNEEIITSSKDNSQPLANGINDSSADENNRSIHDEKKKRSYLEANGNFQSSILQSDPSIKIETKAYKEETPLNSNNPQFINYPHSSTDNYDSPNNKEQLPRRSTRLDLVQLCPKSIKPKNQHTKIASSLTHSLNTPAAPTFTMNSENFINGHLESFSSPTTQPCYSINYSNPVNVQEKRNQLNLLKVQWDEDIEICTQK